MELEQPSWDTRGKLRVRNRNLGESWLLAICRAAITALDAREKWPLLIKTLSSSVSVIHRETSSWQVELVFSGVLFPGGFEYKYLKSYIIKTKFLLFLLHYMPVLSSVFCKSCRLKAYVNEWLLSLSEFLYYFLYQGIIFTKYLLYLVKCAHCNA